MMDKINNIQEVGGYLSYFFYVDESGVKKKKCTFAEKYTYIIATLTNY